MFSVPTIKPHDEAADLIRSKPILTRKIFDQLLPELKARAFTISGIESANTLQRIRDAIASLPVGRVPSPGGTGEPATWDSVKADLINELDPFLGDASEARAELLLRTQTFQAFQAANWHAAQADLDTTHLQYLATEDDRVRDTHLALNGIILPKDDPFWNDHYPPWEWNCRCRVRPMNPDLVDLEREKDAKRNPEDRLVIEGPQLSQLNHGILHRGNRSYNITPDPNSTFHFHPDDLSLSLDDLKQRYDPDTWSDFETWSKTQQIPNTPDTIWDWLSGSSSSSSSSSKVRPPPPAPPSISVPSAPISVPPSPNPIQAALKKAKFSTTLQSTAASLPTDIANKLSTATFHPTTGGAFYRPSEKSIHLQKDPTKWSGHPSTFHHESGHHLHFETNAITNTSIHPDFTKALKDDFTAWQSAMDAQHPGGTWKAIYDRKNPFSLLNQIAKDLGLPGFDPDQDLPGAKRVSRIADTISGLSKGKYGGGHKLAYMKTRNNSAMEVFAHAYSAIIDPDPAFQSLFKNTVAFVKKHLNI